jgi:hypothetical protein
MKLVRKWLVAVFGREEATRTTLGTDGKRWLRWQMEHKGVVASIRVTAP